MNPRQQTTPSTPEHNRPRPPSPTTRNAFKNHGQQTTASTTRHARACKPSPTPRNAIQHRKQQTTQARPSCGCPGGSSLRVQAAAAALDASIYRKRQAAASAPRPTQAHEPSPTTRNAFKHSKQQTAAGTPKHAQASKPTPTTHDAFQHRKQQTATSTPKRRPPGHRHGPLMRGEANKHKRPADGARVGHDLALKTEAHHAGSLPLRTENIAAHARRPKA